MRRCVVGSALPDLVAAVPVTWQILRGTPPAAIVAGIRRRPRRREFHRAAHSALAPLALMALRPLRPMGIGCASHVAVDLITHHSDAWPHMWPFDPRVVRSPISYWERDRGGLAFRWAEMGLLVAGALTERRAHRRLIGLAAAGCAAVPLAWEMTRGLRRPAAVGPALAAASGPGPPEGVNGAAFTPAWRLRLEPEGTPAGHPSPLVRSTRRSAHRPRTGVGGAARGCGPSR